MAVKATKAEVWAVAVDDRAGGLADKLEALAGAGADFEMVFARRTPEAPGQGVLFVTPLRGAKAQRAAASLGMGRPQTIHSVRVEGGDKPGLGAHIARTLGRAGVSFRGLSAIAVGRKFICYLALDSAEDADKAIKALKKIS